VPTRPSSNSIPWLGARSRASQASPFRGFGAPAGRPPSPVVLSGASGPGQQLVARALNRESGPRRQRGPVVAGSTWGGPSLGILIESALFRAMNAAAFTGPTTRALRPCSTQGRRAAHALFLDGHRREQCRWKAQDAADAGCCSRENNPRFGRPPPPPAQEPGRAPSSRPSNKICSP